MSGWEFIIVDVFTDRPFGGNPLAVFPDASQIPEQMFQKIAREFNLSETTFVLPPTDPQCDFKVRIFTPETELPIAGHPTLGTIFVLGRLGKLDHKEIVTLQEGVGPVQVQVEYLEGGGGKEVGLVTMDQPLPEFFEPIRDRDGVAEMLNLSNDDLVSGLPIRAVSSGVPFIYVPLWGLDAVARAKPRPDVLEYVLRNSPVKEVMVFCGETEHATSTVHTRMFAPFMGINEDPATGIASGPLGAYLVEEGMVEKGSPVEIVSEQGFEMGRPSFLNITIDHDQGEINRVRVGGTSVFIARGEFQPLDL